MARDLPEEEQDAIAMLMVEHMRQDGESLLTPEQIAEVERRIADPNETRVPFDEVVERLKRRFG